MNKLKKEKQIYSPSFRQQHLPSSELIKQQKLKTNKPSKEGKRKLLYFEYKRISGILKIHLIMDDGNGM